MSRKPLQILRAEPVSGRDVKTSPWPGRIAWLKSVPRLIQHARAPVSSKRFSLPFHQDAEILIIVPPFASLWYPSLAAHVLQACIHRAGARVHVLYANILLASFIGEAFYEQVGAESVSHASERFFARCAFGTPALGHGAEHMFDPQRIFGEERGVLYRGLYPDSKATTLGFLKRSGALETFKRWEARAPDWIDKMATAIVARRYKIVGCTTTFQQTSASIALLNRVKALDPAIVTVLGGANCEGEMADGLLTVGAKLDYIFSGESEETFPEFVRSVLSGARPPSPIVRGSPLRDMDSLPALSSTEFFEQRNSYLPLSAPGCSTLLSYETSRGCWWGQKQHCTFCGLNGEGMAFRRKSPERVISELRELLKQSPTKNIAMTDNIMPHDYLKTLLPRLRDELPGVSIFYEQKSNLSFKDVSALQRAGVTAIQPGIEALSSRLLKLMRKGVHARQNLGLLRYARIVGMKLNWNLICGFPNDELAVYSETMALVPLIVHLEPPSGMWHLSIDRFSPYFFEPDVHKVTNIRPLPVYKDLLPPTADVAKIAYHFLGDYPSDTHRFIEQVRELNTQIQHWVGAWEKPYKNRPELKITRHKDKYVLFDTRELPGTETMQYLDDSEAVLLMNANPYKKSREENQAIERKLAVVVDNWFVPLPVAREELFRELSTECHGLATASRGTEPLRTMPELQETGVPVGAST